MNIVYMQTPVVIQKYFLEFGLSGWVGGSEKFVRSTDLKYTHFTHNPLTGLQCFKQNKHYCDIFLVQLMSLPQVLPSEQGFSFRVNYNCHHHPGCGLMGRNVQSARNSNAHRFSFPTWLCLLKVMKNFLHSSK